MGAIRGKCAFVQTGAQSRSEQLLQPHACFFVVVFFFLSLKDFWTESDFAFVLFFFFVFFFCFFLI